MILTREERRALECLKAYGDPAAYEEMVQTIVRGQADGIMAQEDGVLLHHTSADVYMIAARTDECLEELLSHVPMGATDVVLHGVTDAEQALRVRARFHLKYAHPYRVYAYYGEMPEIPQGVDIRPIGIEVLDFVYANYGHASREYLAARLSGGVMLGAFVQGELVAFIGEHVEGSMGLLHVMPAYRRLHLGYALECAAIRRTMMLGQTPFDQVVMDNAASHALQKKLSMTQAQSILYWMTDDAF